MDNEWAKSWLKWILLREIAYLCRHGERQWNSPIVETLENVRQLGSRAVFFGGTLRSLLVSRLFDQRPGRPRDVDIVIAKTTIDKLREHFRTELTRETRFGGLSLHNKLWQFDVWPLNRTWAFVQNNEINPSFDALPQTTFLNLEAIAVDVWPSSNGKRKIYSADDQFFNGILTRTLELNQESNPFPGLCVLRSLTMAARLDFSIGPRLAKYIAIHGNDIADHELETVQQKHYGKKRYDGKTLKCWISHITEQHMKNDQQSVRLPIPRQLMFWPEHDAIAYTLYTLSRGTSSGIARPNYDKPS